MWTLRRPESYREHFIGLVKNEHLHGIRLEETALDHVVDTARSADDDLGAVLEGLHVVAHTGSTNASVALNLHEVANGDDHLLDLLSKLTRGCQDQGLTLLEIVVNLLENGNGKRGRLASSRLGLGNDVVALDDRHDGALLNSRRSLKTIGVD